MHLKKPVLDIPTNTATLLTWCRQYKHAVDEQLHSILQWWMQYMPDEKHGGFYGSVDANGIAQPNVPRGLVMYSRILWFFSAAYGRSKSPEHLQMANRALNDLQAYFTDRVYGGMYWSIHPQGQVCDDKKQVYGQAFAIYALAEYCRVNGNTTVLAAALQLFELLQQKNSTIPGGGYAEAFSRQWGTAADWRLSAKDANEKKSMNTHLHVLEAYTHLYSVSKSPAVAVAIGKLLPIFEHYIIDADTLRQHLFFDEAWRVKSDIISYGHDVEASWLLYEAALVLEDAPVIEKWKQLAIKMAAAAIDGVDADGGMWYEREAGQLIKEKHWWPQAEAMVGFLNAYELSGARHFALQSYQSFAFAQKHLRHPVMGEWHWGIDANGKPMAKEMAGFWKCPYHNGRACMEVSRRLENIIRQLQAIPA